jgi:hypothetical protein
VSVVRASNATDLVTETPLGNLVSYALTRKQRAGSSSQVVDCERLEAMVELAESGIECVDANVLIARSFGMAPAGEHVLAFAGDGAQPLEPRDRARDKWNV